MNSQPQAGSMTSQLSQPQAGFLNRFFKKPKGLRGAAQGASQPYTGASQPQTGAGISQPQTGSATQASQPRCLLNSLLNKPTRGPHGAGASQPQTGS